MKKRVVHVITDLDVGGAEKQLSIILPYLQESFENHVICAIGKGSIARKLERDGIPVHYLNLKSRNDVRATHRLYRMLKQLHPDILITYLIYADITGRIIGRLTGARKIICSQRSSLLERDYLRSIDKLTKYLVSIYTVQTETYRKFLSARLNVNESRFAVIPNAVEVIDNGKKPRSRDSIALRAHRLRHRITLLDKKTEKRQQLGLKDDDIVVAYVGHMKKGKGHHVLLQAAKLISNFQFPTSRSVHFLLIGDGVLRKQLEEGADTLGVQDTVHFLGKRDDVQDILAMSDIFTFPSHGEGMSNALLEAMAAGLPCVVSDIEVNKEIIANGDNGVLFKTGDPTDLSDKLDVLISNPELRSQLGERAQKYVRTHHNPKIIAQQWASLITNIASS